MSLLYYTVHMDDYVTSKRVHECIECEISRGHLLTVRLQMDEMIGIITSSNRSQRAPTRGDTSMYSMKRRECPLHEVGCKLSELRIL